MNFSNIQWSVTKSVNVTFLFRLEGLKLNDTDWINNLKEKRTQYSVSQNRLAVMAGVSREYVSRLESGKVALTEEIKVKFTDALEKLNPENPLEMVLDYVRIRFPTQDVKHVVEDILKLRLDVMIHEDYGFYSYAEHYVLGDVFVLASPDKEKGTLLELKGKGCRQMRRNYNMMKSTKKCPLFSTISLAADGDEVAIEKILNHYDAYISKASLRPFYDEHGNMYIVVDMELKGRIRAALIKAILGFEVRVK